MARVLVVDDEANHVRVLSIGLRIEGFEVVPARNAETALAALAVQTTDLAIIDLMMPGINGIELARKIRAAYPEIRVVLTSAYHLSERQLLRADCGAIGFVPKPYDLSELARFLRGKLSGGTERDVRALGDQRDEHGDSADVPARLTA